MAVEKHRPEKPRGKKEKPAEMCSLSGMSELRHGIAARKVEITFRYADKEIETRTLYLCVACVMGGAKMPQAPHTVRVVWNKIRWATKGEQAELKKKMRKFQKNNEES